VICLSPYPLVSRDRSRALPVRCGMTQKKADPLGSASLGRCSGLLWFHTAVNVRCRVEQDQSLRPDTVNAQ
jgi:hypothetical protein